jgi:hypothetical protein
MAMNWRRIHPFFLFPVIFRCGSVHFAHQPGSGEAFDPKFAHFDTKSTV